MFNETNYLGALGYSGADTQWFALGYKSRADWKAAGRPLTPASGGSVSTTMPGLPGGGTPTISLPNAGDGSAGGAPPSSGGGGGFSLSSIPLWVWLIAGAFLLMKK